MLRLKIIREQRGITLRELAETSGVSFSTISKIERGIVKNPAYHAVLNLAAALGVKPEVLLKPRTQATTK